MGLSGEYYFCQGEKMLQATIISSMANIHQETFWANEAFVNTEIPA